MCASKPAFVKSGHILLLFHGEKVFVDRFVTAKLPLLLQHMPNYITLFKTLTSCKATLTISIDYKEHNCILHITFCFVVKSFAV